MFDASGASWYAEKDGLSARIALTVPRRENGELRRVEGAEFGGEVPLLLPHDGGPHRHPLLEQLPVGRHVAVLHKAFLHHVVPQGVVDGGQAHPQVVGHIGADHLPVLAPGKAGGGVVHRLVKAVTPLTQA